MAIVIQTRLTQIRRAKRLGADAKGPQAADKTPASARETLALNIIRLRADKGWSQEALAFEAGLHRTFIAHVERQVRNISIDNIERIAVALGVPVWQLLKP